jgi:uncharacterized protein YdeI (YjbR/CyaY-like superfamily)
MEPVYFATPDDLRRWFTEHHEQAQELWVGYFKKASGKPSVTWPESVDQAICYGWIDGVRKTIDDDSYKIRFTPRKKSSIWSKVNIDKANVLIARGLMQPAGLKAFQERKDDKSAIYSYEQENPTLSDEDERQLRANEKAWAFFHTQPGSYQKAAQWWVVSAKQEATRVKRLAKLIEESANGRRLAQFTYTRKTE